MLKSIFFPPSHQEFLHGKNFLHGNIRARGVLVTKEFTAKLWGLHGVYMRNNKGTSQREDPSMKKWQAPELLAKRIPGQSSDMWVFHLHLYTHLFSLSHCCRVNGYSFLPCFYWETLTPLSSLVLPAGPLAFYCLKWRHLVRLPLSMIPFFVSAAIKGICTSKMTSVSIQGKPHLQKSQSMNCCSFINGGKAWKNLPTAPTRCMYQRHALEFVLL